MSSPAPRIQLAYGINNGNPTALAVVNLCAPGVSVRTTRYEERGALAIDWAARTGVDLAVNGDLFEYGSYAVTHWARSGGVDWPPGTHNMEPHPNLSFARASPCAERSVARFLRSRRVRLRRSPHALPRRRKRREPRACPAGTVCQTHPDGVGECAAPGSVGRDAGADVTIDVARDVSAEAVVDVADEPTRDVSGDDALRDAPLGAGRIALAACVGLALLRRRRRAPSRGAVRCARRATAVRVAAQESQP